MKLSRIENICKEFTAKHWDKALMLGLTLLPGCGVGSFTSEYAVPKNHPCYEVCQDASITSTFPPVYQKDTLTDCEECIAQHPDGVGYRGSGGIGVAVCFIDTMKR